eukprot:GHVH01017170.1.p1 GENE.GHVH01017170.1~~GHVH01017170.1.p1  ORF type:complete len:429 (-),score=63.60 GHVH01017170.1:179-1465(-)
MVEEDTGETEEIFLRTKIEKFMNKFTMSSERQLTIKIVKSQPPPQTTELNEHRAQLTAIRDVMGTGVACIYSDGNFKLFDYDGVELLKCRLSPLPLTHLSLTELVTTSEFIYYDIAVVTIEGFTVRHCLMRISIEDGIAALDVDGMSLLPEWIGHQSPISAMAMFNHGSRMVTGDSCGHIRIYNCDDGAPGVLKRKLMEGDMDGLFGNEEAEKARKRPRTDTETSKLPPLRDIRPFKGAVTGFAVPSTPQGAFGFHFFAGGVDQTLKVIDSITMGEVASYSTPRPIQGVDINESTNSILTCHDDGRVVVWDIKKKDPSELSDVCSPFTGSAIVKVKQWGQFRRIATSVQWCPENLNLFNATLADGTTKVFDTRCSTVALHNIEVTPFKHCIAVLTGCWTTNLDDETNQRVLFTGSTDGVLRKHLVYAH